MADQSVHLVAISFPASTGRHVGDSRLVDPMATRTVGRNAFLYWNAVSGTGFSQRLSLPLFIGGRPFPVFSLSRNHCTGLGRNRTNPGTRSVLATEDRLHPLRVSTDFPYPTQPHSEPDV